MNQRLLSLGLASLLCGLVWSTPVQAQPPARVSFTPSTDHDRLVDAVPLVTRYDFVVARVATPTTIVATTPLGKPTPTSGTITADITATLAALSPGSYVARIAAVGPGGSGVSPPSDPFVIAPAPAPPGKPSIELSAPGVTVR